MSLRAFHVIFISTSVLLAFGFGAWCLDAQPSWLGAGLVSFAFGLGLVGYEAWFLTRMRRLP
jgi:hypothetical protein